MTERFRHIELEITSVCDMGCPNCDRFITEAPSGPMTVEQVRHFVQESLDLEWVWDRMHILGGEPTLHRQFRAVVSELLEYRTYYPQTRLVLISNGSGKLREHRDWLKSQGVQINIESKVPRTDPPYFQNMRLAPVDRGHTTLEPCALFGISGCGLGLTKHGFFMCGAGAAIARVTGQDLGVQRLADATFERMQAQAAQLCHLCGHHETVSVLASQDRVVSPFWRDALARYAGQGVPALTLYGAP